jgi:hypothetical protein
MNKIDRQGTRLIIIAVSVIIVVSVVAGFQYFAAKTTETSFSSNSTLTTPSSWSSLHGVDYFYSTISSDNGGPASAPEPSVSFPQIRANGWNLIRVNLYWNLYLDNPTQFIRDVQTIATYAVQNGLYVIWDLNHGDKYVLENGMNGGNTERIPTSLAAGYSTDEEFWTAWWANQTTYKGESDWSMDLQYDLQVVKAVDNYSSTLGYEIMNEPTIYSNTNSSSGSYNFQGMQNFNNYIGEGIRTITSKVIFFDRPYPNPDNLNQCAPACYLESYPSKVSNIAMDIHLYNTYNPTFWSQYASFAKQIGVNVVVGEWAPCDSDNATCITSETAVNQFISTYMNAFKSYGWAWCYYRWASGNPGPYWQSLLSNDQQWWLDQSIVKVQKQIYGSS